MNDPQAILPLAPKPVVDLITELNLKEVTGDIRHWGGYIHLEVDTSSDKKVLWVTPTEDTDKPVKALSLQFHGINGVRPHSEKFQAQTDMVHIIGKTDLSRLQGEEFETALTEELEHNLQMIFLHEGEWYETPGGVIHAYTNPFPDKLVMLIEQRISPEPQEPAVREANIYRVLDQDGRGSRGEYTQEILDRIRAASVKKPLF